MVATAELQAIEERYRRRRTFGTANRYSLLDPYAMLVDQEKDRALVQILKSSGMAVGVPQRTLLEIGCAGGGNLLRFLRMGFRPENIAGSDLIPHRLRDARALLPSSVRLIPGDATQLECADASFDIVCLFTVFSSILDDAFQERLAAKAWSLTKPGGGILWYDFVYNNPANPDVRGVPLSRVRDLFAGATHNVRRITLAPPIGRRVTRIGNGCYAIFNWLPFLRSHVLVWISKGG